jgi:class 3 adenylate cyclase/predicted ATPase/energy-coupling factor transporter ATP-binding protein EcfA2
VGDFQKDSLESFDSPRAAGSVAVATPDINAWLEARGLGHLAGIFSEHDIDVEVLPHLTDGDLRELGLSLGVRRKLLSAIASDAAPRASDAGPADGAASAPAAASTLEAERRQLTVMFCDLVDSTSLSTRLDPEELGGVLRAYQSCCAEAVGRFGGRIAKYMGDGILIFFGYPVAHEDDAERAVHAALAAARSVCRLRPHDGLTLHVRIGIATGLVVVGERIGEGSAQEYTVFGKTPNLAARLQGAAEWDGIVIAESTRRLIGDLFECAELSAVALKGFDAPVRAWRVKGESRAEGRFEALHAKGMIPVVGRQQEIARLLELWRQAKASEGQVVLLTGEPGVGKSRLTRVLRERLRRQDHIRLSYYCSPHYTTSPLHPIIAQLERAAGITQDDTAVRKLDKLEAALADSRAPADEIVPVVAALLSVPVGGRYPPLVLAPQQFKERTLRTLVFRLEELAARRPVVAVFEDIQWTDPTSLDLVNRTIERIKSLPILLLITARPEFASPWATLGHVTHLSLNKLSRRQGSAVVEKLVGGKALPAELLEQIVAKADGIPLFLEELTKTVLESGLLQEEDDRYTLRGPLQPLAVPTTLHDSLMARLDRMSAVKQVAQLAATVGRAIPLELLGAVSPLSPRELESALAQLVDAGIVFRKDRARQAVYQFKHALLQDVAYQSLLKSTRQQYHERIGRTLEAKFPEIAEVQPELLAHHFAEAGRVKDAIRYWRRAGRRATQRSANLEAISQLQHALRLVGAIPDSAKRARQEYRLHLALISPLIAIKGYAAPEMEQTITRALQLSEEIGDASQILPVLYGRYAYHQVTGQLRKATALAEEFMRHAERPELREALPIARRLVGASRFMRGDSALGRTLIEAAIAEYDPRTHRSSAFVYGQDHLVSGLGYLCLALWHQGLVGQALDRHREVLAHARSLSHANSLGFALTCGGAMLHALCRDAGPVRAYADELCALGAEYKLPLWSATGRFFLGLALSETAGDPEGVALMEDGLAAFKAIHVQLFRPSCLVWLADSARRLGAPQRGLKALDEAWAVLRTSEESWMEAELHRLNGEFLLDRPAAHRADAEHHFLRALQVARDQGSPTLALRAAISLARLWRDQAKPREALALLQRHGDRFEPDAAFADLVEARSFLEGVGQSFAGSPRRINAT